MKHTKELKEVFRSNRLNDQRITERPESNITSVEERVESTVKSLAEQQSLDVHERENKISQSTREMKEVVRNTKLDDQMDTEGSANNIRNVEERTESTVMSQAEQLSPKLYEKENRIPQNTKEESGQLKEYGDLIMNKKIAAVERDVDEIVTQVKDKPQEIDENVAIYIYERKQRNLHPGRNSVPHNVTSVLVDLLA